MCLATASPAGKPRTRIVLLKDFSEHGLVFYTNYSSSKAQAMEQNQAVSVNFIWHALAAPNQHPRQHRKKLTERSEAYFHSRPRGSQLGAIVSPQSSVIASRTELEDRLAELDARYAEKPIPLPENWGGIRIIPTRFEFWQGRDNRLHDRFEYQLSEGNWSQRRPSPHE